MKKTIKKVLTAFIAGAFLFSFPVFASEGAFATEPETQVVENRCTHTLGFTPWDCGIPEKDAWAEENIEGTITKIAMNVGVDLTVLASYAVIAFVIYGGYMYLGSAGDATKVATGKRALTNAFIGLGIVLFANIIFNAIRVGLLSGTTMTEVSVSGETVRMIKVEQPEAMIGSTIQWVVGIAGVIALIFVVYGGISYLTSSGDPVKSVRARNVLLYAAIGLTIVAIAEIITGFVTSKMLESKQGTVQTGVIERRIDTVGIESTAGGKYL